MNDLDRETSERSPERADRLCFRVFGVFRGWFAVVKAQLCLLFRWTLALAFLCCLASSLQAHIGSPNVFFEGYAGPYPVRIIVRPPEVIPGLAEISVRVATNGVERVTALPMRWNTGRQGAPPPDVARRVRGETNLYTSELWFMQGGAQSVEVEVQGTAGSAKVIVPVNAVATRVLEMPRGLGWVLACLGSLLVLLLVTVIGAAVRESVLAPGTRPTLRRRWLARGACLGALLLLGGGVWAGERWWNHESADYHNNRLYRPLQTEVQFRSAAGHPSLRLEILDERFYRGAPLVPDHGKLMHLFLVREPGLDAFAHLHPQKVDWKTFETALPNLPAGRYSLYADITTETGFADTLTSTVDTAATKPTGETDAPVLSDPDDSWRQAPPLSGAVGARANPESFESVEGGCVAEWVRESALLANRETALRFSVHDRAGKSVPLEPYLGMAAHLVLRRKDGSVFTHLHPGGSISMAAQQLFEMRAEGRAPLKAAQATNDPICRLPSTEELAATWRTRGDRAPGGLLSFPYAFPKPGQYRLWLQFKTAGEIRTAVFDAQVQPGKD